MNLYFFFVLLIDFSNIPKGSKRKDSEGPRGKKRAADKIDFSSLEAKEVSETTRRDSSLGKKEVTIENRVRQAKELYERAISLAEFVSNHPPLEFYKSTTRFNCIIIL